MLESLELIGMGFSVVMSALIVLWASCAVVGFFFTRTARHKPQASKPAPARAAVAARAGVPPHHLAAIAAAVAHTLGAGYRVTRVAAPPHKVTAWPLEGRIEAFSAHRIRTNWGPTRPAMGGETPDIMRGQK